MVGNLPSSFYWQTFLNTLFFRFATDYAYETGESLIAGYAKKSKFYLWAFFILSMISGMISTGAVVLLTAVILSYMLPFEPSTVVLSAVMVVASWTLLIFGHFRMLDNVTKWIIILLTVTTILAVIIAGVKAPPPAHDFVAVSPFNMAGLSFIIALMGWMPTPLEFSVISSVWTSKKFVMTIQHMNRACLTLMSAILALPFWRYFSWLWECLSNMAQDKKLPCRAVLISDSSSICTPTPLANGQEVW